MFMAESKEGSLIGDFHQEKRIVSVGYIDLLTRNPQKQIHFIMGQ